MMSFVLYREAMMEFFASVSRHPERHHGEYGDSKAIECP
jgi:hypothetical protein